jgi:hypothetical protein
MMTHLIGTLREAWAAAVRARFSKPMQHGTCMIITVSVLIFASSINARSLAT